MTPMQWVANELSIELRAKQIASHTLEYISKEMGVSPASLSYYIDSGMPAPEHAYLYCKRAFHINLDYVLTALRSKRAMRGSRKKMPRLKKYAKPSSLIFFCAFRYALGRATYIVKSVTDEIIHNIDLIETNDLRLMAKEIREAIKEKRAGFDCDIAEWMKLAKRVDYELEDRAEDI